MIVRTGGAWLRAIALLCIASLVPGDVSLMAQAPATQAPAAQAPAAEAPALRSPEQLDSLVAPIALYPDSLLAQILAASTYPLEIVQARRWLTANSNLKGEELTKAAAKQPWDPSVQALVAFPDVLKRLDEGVQWTTDLGNAFLDQQGDVMDAVQRMRRKAYDAGKLQSSKEQKVEVKTVETKTIVEIVPSDPQVVYVPSYNPTVVWGAPAYAAYPYPPVYYPPYPYGAVAATAAISFGVGVAMGAFWGGCCGHGGWGWNCGWGGNNIQINNNFHNRYGYNNINGGNRINNGNSSWQHNGNHRKSVPYSNRNTAQRFGGASRDIGTGRTDRFDRSGQPRRSQGDVGRGQGGLDRRQGGGLDRGQAGREGLGGRTQQAGGRDTRAGQDRVGNRSFDSSAGRGGRESAFSGSDSRTRTQSASDRGFSSARGSSSAGMRSSGGSSGGGRSAGGGGYSGGAARSAGGGRRGGGRR